MSKQVTEEIRMFLLTLYAFAFRFISVGDTGKANEGQYLVGAAMAQYCLVFSCDFASLLGDNFYGVGVSSVDDPQFVTKFEEPYKNVNVPFYVTLGNHDYGKFANDWKRGAHQVAYSAKNPKWILPDYYYAFEHKDVLFVMLDTSRLFHNKDTKKQTEFVKQALENSNAKWKIVMGHHPYLSNGEHGNAGKYDGVLIPPYSGSVIKKLYEDVICKHADLVLSGHDHNLQILPATAKCANTLFVVSGAGASLKEFKDRNRNPTYFQDDLSLGFTSFEVRNNAIAVEMWNEKMELLHRHDLFKKN